MATISYDPTGKEYVISELTAKTDVYKLTIQSNMMFDFISIHLYRNDIHLDKADMDCQEAKITTEMWGVFVKNLTKMLTAVNVEMPVKSLKEKIWDIMVKIGLTVTDDHLSADIPEHYEG